MGYPRLDLGSAAVCRYLAIGGCLLAVLGAKLWLIASVGNPTPIWDQWDGEAAALYLPYLSGTLSPFDLLNFHNEHRIALTRATALALLYLSGSWDPILQMLFNALVHVLAIGLLAVLLGRLLNLASLMFFLGFVLLFFSVPFGWDNTLGGFQSQFYFMILLSLLSLYLLCHAGAWSMSWWVGTLLAFAGYFSIASGAMILPAAIVLAAMQLALGARTGVRELAGLALHAVISIALLHDLLRNSAHQDIHANSLWQLINWFLVSASWPIAATSWPAALRIIPAALVNASAVVLAVQVLMQRPSITDRRWYCLAIAAWFAAQLLVLSYGRPGGTLESRYNDIFLVGLVLNCACWLYLISAPDGGPVRHKAILWGPAIWLLAIMLGAGQKATNNVVDGISLRYGTGQQQLENVKNFVATGDFAHLDNKPKLHIPYPSAERLRDLLSETKLRTILPAALTGAPERVSIKAAVLAHGPMLIPLGLAFFVIAAMAAYQLGRKSE